MIKLDDNAKSISFRAAFSQSYTDISRGTALYRHNRKYLVAFIILRKLCRALVIEKGREGNINGAILRALIVPGFRAMNARSIFTLITIANERNKFNHRQLPSGRNSLYLREETYSRE